MDSKNAGQVRKIATLKRPDVVTIKRKKTAETTFGRWKVAISPFEVFQNLLFCERITVELFSSNPYMCHYLLPSQMEALAMMCKWESKTYMYVNM